ncbi:hypothetical protein NQ317_001435 [Molorchus minor]|uniref:Uncharacterized protein n=1 Tax=Molorchus minor TaxID=1323400 RepID=A0ABQ9JYK6_9CUCU|nr:hypothetical protein NQ317_001435 [Molorchus minor]
MRCAVSCILLHQDISNLQNVQENILTFYNILCIYMYILYCLYTCSVIVRLAHVEINLFLKIAVDDLPFQYKP